MGSDERSGPHLSCTVQGVGHGTCEALHVCIVQIRHSPLLS